jgi:intracellular septation protein A
VEIGAIIHVVKPLSSDLLATLRFYAVFAVTGSVGITTVLAAALGVVQLAWTIARGQPVPPIQWVSLPPKCLTGPRGFA